MHARLPRLYRVRAVYEVIVLARSADDAADFVEYDSECRSNGADFAEFSAEEARTFSAEEAATPRG